VTPKRAGRVLSLVGNKLGVASGLFTLNAGVAKEICNNLNEEIENYD